MYIKKEDLLRSLFAPSRVVKISRQPGSSSCPHCLHHPSLAWINLGSCYEFLWILHAFLGISS